MDAGAWSPGSAGRTFVGREDETRRLLELLELARGGKPVMALVRGEAGVGKSRLLREFADEAQAAGAQVLWGSCIALGVGLCRPGDYADLPVK